MADNMNGSSEDQSVATEPPTPAQEVPACSVMSQEPDCSILEESADVNTPPPEEESPSPSPTPESEPKENGSAAVDKKKDKKKTKKGKQGGAEGSAADAKEIEQTIKQTMQTLNAMDNPDEKLGAIVKRYAELLGDHRSLQREFKAGQRMQAQVMREKEKLQAEHSKALLARSKLESLCRELQRHNKAIKEESQRKMKEEEEKRREISSKFQTTLGEISTQMDDNRDRSLKMKEENMELCGKLKSLVEQYEKREEVLLKDINEQMNISREKSSLLRKENVDLMKSMKELISKYEEREEHVEKLIKQKDLERQLAEAKMQQATMMLAEEKEKFLTEKQVLLKENYAHRERAEQMAIQEENMKMQLKLYTEKFEELHKTLNQSNEVFNKFKVEMDTMNKRMKKLEKESFQWRTKWEKSNVTLIAMAEEKQTRDKELIMLRTKCGKLENLCRALQNARSDTESGADKVSEVLTKFEEAEQTLAAEIRANKSSTTTTTTTDIPVPDPTPTDGAAAGTGGGDESGDIGEADAGPGPELSAAAGGGDADDVDDFIALIRADTTRLEDMPKPPPEELSLLDILNMKDPIRGEPSLEGAEKEKEKEGGEVEKGVEDDVDTVPSKLEAID